LNRPIHEGFEAFSCGILTHVLYRTNPDVFWDCAFSLCVICHNLIAHLQGLWDSTLKKMTRMDDTLSKLDFITLSEMTQKGHLDDTKKSQR
jgi:hypothetical protein